jgi:hypothetical protein
MSFQDQPEEEYLIIGPSQSGKTCLVGVLDHASTMVSPAQFEINPENPDMERLIGQAGEVSRNGRMPWNATSATTTYKFSIRSQETPKFAPLTAPVVPPRPDRLKVRKHMFQLLDGPGEALFPDSNDQSEMSNAGETKSPEQQLIELGRRSKGIILAIDVNDVSSVSKFFTSLGPALRKMANADHYVPFERMVLVLTKADKFFQENRRDAHKLALQANPWSEVQRLLGRAGMRNLTRFMHPNYRKRIYCGWASVYGFVPDEGSANFKKDDNGEESLAVYDPNDPFFINKWEPFQILDPFVFLATGEEIASLKQIPPEFQ